MKHPWKVLYKDCSFSFDPSTNMAQAILVSEKSTNQKQELPVAAMFVNGTELKEQSL
jgi:hypothetical protein